MQSKEGEANATCNLGASLRTPALSVVGVRKERRKGSEKLQRNSDGLLENISKYPVSSTNSN
jgi:hypothetical protein